MLDRDHFSNTLFIASSSAGVTVLWMLGVGGLDPYVALVSTTYMLVKALTGARREPFDAALLAAAAAFIIAAAREVAVLASAG